METCHLVCAQTRAGPRESACFAFDACSVDGSVSDIHLNISTHTIRSLRELARDRATEGRQTVSQAAGSQSAQCTRSCRRIHDTSTTPAKMAKESIMAQKAKQANALADHAASRKKIMASTKAAGDGRGLHTLWGGT